MNAFSKRRVKLVFTLTFVNIGFAVLCTLISHYYDFIWLRNYNALNILAYVSASYLAIKNRLVSARIIYLITSNFGLAIIASYVGRPGSIEYVYMFNIGLPFILFSFRREKFFVIFFTILPLLLWTLLYLTDFNLFATKKLSPEIARSVIYPMAVVSSIALIIFQLIYFCIINAQYYKKINLKKLEAIEASNAKSRFLSTMSHEIRTPLNAVIGLSHILANNKPRKDQIENIDALNYSGKILLNLLNNVLDFSKMQSTKIELDEIPTDISIATKQIKKIHEANCLKKGIQMNLIIDDAIPKVWLDIVRFNQVINNLVTNAIKFTEKGSVSLKIIKQKQTNTHVQLYTEVKDTGIGIPKNKHETIWKAFTQASSNTNRLYGGTGLGLPIVKNIVEAMQSNIKLESSLGEGSRFYFTLDLKVAVEKDIEKNDKKKNFHFSKQKVLIVEDNLINVMVCKQILEKENLTIEVVNNGLEAVNKVRNNRYDIVLMDIQMPIMDGYAAAMEIRKFNTSVPILALSASVFMEVKDKINKSGMNGFVFKPFEPEDLLNEIFNNIKKAPQKKSLN